MGWKIGKKKKETVQKEISYKRLVYEALPEIWSFKFLAGILLGIAAWVIKDMIGFIAGVGGKVLTTANIKDALFSWKAPVLLILGFALILAFVLFEIFAQIYMCDDILNGREVRVFKELKRGIKAFRLFMTPAGLAIIAYIFIAVPLCGLGFSISLTKSFYIPNFIMDVVLAKPLYAVAYIMLILGLVWFGFNSIFSVHAVLIDGYSPKEAHKISRSLIKKNWKKFVLGMLKLFIILGIIRFLANFLLSIPEGVLEELQSDMPERFLDMDYLNAFEFTDDDWTVIAYRVICAFAVLMVTFLDYIIVFLTSALIMLMFTRYYREFSVGNGEEAAWLERPKKSRYIWKIVSFFLFAGLLIIVSCIIGFFYDVVFNERENVKIVAHRTGGYLASENSLEGIEEAIKYGCYGSETDVQRTKDGHYVINHDNDFKRLTGVAKKPGEMTLDEIKELRIKDTTGNGNLLSPVTIEEMLDTVKGGRIRLFIELKGESADVQMADDLVKIIREKDCVDDVAMISLNYNVIDYIETNYPEFMTGTLFFAGVGDVSRLNCDLIMVEEEMATGNRIYEVHSHGKELFVWTVNTVDGLYDFLDMNVDGVITDDIVLAVDTQEELDGRSVMTVLNDNLYQIWN